MKKTSIIILVVPLVIFFSFSQSSKGARQDQVLHVNDTISFSQHVFPIIFNKCSSVPCHGQKQPPIFLIPKRVIKYSDRIKARISTKKEPMPPADAEETLNQEEIKIINQWIDAGSPNN